MSKTKQDIEALYSSLGMDHNVKLTKLTLADNLLRYNPVGTKGKSGGGLIPTHGGFLSQPLTNQSVAIAEDSNEYVAMFQKLQDADTYQYGPYSSGAPEALTTVWTTRQIKQLYKNKTADLITEPWQQGTFGTTNIKIPMSQIAGHPVLYNENGMGGSSSTNYQWIDRRVVYWEQSINYGEMQEAQFSLAKIPYVADLREATAETVAQFQNDLTFNGYVAGDCTLNGILNDYNLKPMISLPADGQVPGTSTPTVSATGKDFFQQVRDIRILVEQATNQSGGTVSALSPSICAMSPASLAALSGTPNPLGSNTALEFLQNTYKNMEFVAVPNFTAGANVFGQQPNQTAIYLMYKHPSTGELPISKIFTTLWQGHRPVPMASSINEKISFGLSGALVKYPFLIVSAYGF